jgi:hypothetical protein
VRIASTVWVIAPELVIALDEHLGAPVDAYVNGAHTWFSGGPAGATLEWRLHPVAAYRAPRGVSHEDLWEAVVAALSAGADAAALRLGEETRPLTSLWDGLECFPAYGDDVEPATLAASAAGTLGLAPDRAGLVDHDRVGDAWEQARGSVSIVALLLEQLST